MKHFYFLLTLMFLLSGTNAVAKSYNTHDLAKVKTLLEQKAANGKRNIDVLWGEGAPATLSADGSNWVGGLDRFFKWDSQGRLTGIYIQWGGHWREQSGAKVQISNNYTRLGGGLDLSGCTALEDIYARNNNFTNVNASGCVRLKMVYICLNQIASVNLEGADRIEQIAMSTNKYTTLDVSNRKNLVKLFIPHNPSLTSLNISGCTSLLDYDAIMTYTSLVSLNVSNCNLNVLNLSGNTNLETLDCSGNNLHSLNISKNTKLKTLNAGNQTVIISDANGREIVLNNGETLTLPVFALSGINVTPSGDGVVDGGNVIWRNISTSGNYSYEFETTLANGLTGTPLSGKATIGAINKGNTIGEGGTPPSGGGCEPDSVDPTANEVVEAYTVYANNGQLYVQLPAPAVVRIHSIIGQVVAQTAKVNEATVALPKGIYFVSIGNSEAKKVVIR